MGEQKDIKEGKPPRESRGPCLEGSGPSEELSPPDGVVSPPPNGASIFTKKTRRQKTRIEVVRKRRESERKYLEEVESQKRKEGKIIDGK